MNDAAEKPTRVRYGVILFFLSLAVITYADRACLAQTAPLIESDLGLNKAQMGWVFTIFSFTYAAFGIAGGWMGDRFGPRTALTRVVIWWSFFTAATGWVKSWVPLMVSRALFGAGEAGCFPNVASAFNAWVPKRQRALAQGLLWASARAGLAFSPLLVVWLLDFFHWRSVFVIFGLVGVVWAIVFRWRFRDRPEDHKGVNAAEMALLPQPEKKDSQGPTPWGRIFRSRTMWALLGQYGFLNFGWAFYYTWLPTYLKEARGVDLKQSAFLAALPLCMGALGSLGSGLLSVPLGRAIGIGHARRVLAMSGQIGAAIGIFLFTRIENPWAAVAVLGVASMANDFAMPASWATCADVGGRYAGTVSGTMNTMGSVCSGLGALFVGYVLQWTGNNWTYALYGASIAYLLAAPFWLLIDPTRSFDDAANPAAA